MLSPIPLVSAAGSSPASLIIRLSATEYMCGVREVYSALPVIVNRQGCTCSENDMREKNACTIFQFRESLPSLVGHSRRRSLSAVLTISNTTGS